MVADLFDSLLQEVGQLLEIADLHADRNNSCLIRFKEGVKVQVEVDSSGEKLLVGCDIVEVPAGKYREIIFREALKANGMPYPRVGTFAYSRQQHRLVIFQYIRMKEIKAEKIAETIINLKEKALMWKTAIEKGETPNLYSHSTTQHAGMFGL